LVVTTRTLAHQAFERVSMNAIEMEELLDQPRRMINGRAQLGEIRSIGREHRVLNHTAQLGEQVRGLIGDDVPPVDVIIVCEGHQNAQRETPFVILKQVHVAGADAEHLSHLGLGLAALATELPKLRSHEGLGHGLNPTKLQDDRLCMETYNTLTRKEKNFATLRVTPLPEHAAIPVGVGKRSPTRRSDMTWKVLILGASYGSLFGTKLLMAGHDVTADEPANVLAVNLPTNFKAATFASTIHNEILRELERDIDAVTLDGKDVPVKLRVHDSLFVPFAKWPMLLTGNYRCATAGEPVSIREAVQSDLARSSDIYSIVESIVLRLGGSADNLVAFDKYVAATEKLISPSSVARAIAGGATAVERVDKLVQLIGRHYGITHPAIDRTVALVDDALERTKVSAA
jgi:hypothetical protein